MKYLQHRNDAVREEERYLATEVIESIPSDHNYDSESSGTMTKRGSSSSKETREQNATAETNLPNMACRFHPDLNCGYDTTERMTTINTAKEGLKYLQHRNDSVREEERDIAAEFLKSIPSDHNSDSESSGTLFKPASSSSKESTLSAKDTDDNKESPFKKSHPRP